MSNYRQDLPQLSGELYLTDAGVETDLIFNHGIEIREFAAHTLLPESIAIAVGPVLLAIFAGLLIGNLLPLPQNTASGIRSTVGGGTNNTGATTPKIAPSSVASVIR